MYGAYAYGAGYYGQGPGAAPEFIPPHSCICVTGEYAPLLQFEGAYAPTMFVGGVYQPVIGVVGEEETCGE